MFSLFIKRTTVAALVSFVACAFAAGCQGDPGAESAGDEASEAAEVGVAQQAINCVAQCVRMYRFCMEAGGTYEECAADREACKEACDEQTCEPGEPGCCQGQPTCW